MKMLPFVFTSLVRRHMKHTPNYHPVGPGNEMDESMLPALEQGEVLVGWYQNPPPHEGCVVYFTSTSIISREPELTSRVRVEDIMYFHPPDTKTGTLGVYLETKEGVRFIRMEGHHGRHHSDAFCLVPMIHAMLGPKGLRTGEALFLFKEGRHYESGLAWCRTMNDKEKAHWAASLLRWFEADDRSSLVAETLSLIDQPEAWTNGYDLFQKVRKYRTSHEEYRQSSSLPGLGLRVCELTCKLIFNATAPLARFDADIPGVIAREFGDNKALFSKDVSQEMAAMMFT
jgi:hypothetical protein